MTKSMGAVLLVVALIVLIVAAWLRASSDGVISMDIRGLLPAAPKETAAEKAANKRFQDALERRQFVLLEGAKAQEVTDAATDLRSLVRDSGLYADDFDQQQTGFVRAASLLFDYRYRLLTAKQQEELSTESGRKSFLEETLNAIYAPFASFSAGLLQHDPFLISTRLLPQRLEGLANNRFTMRNGFLTSRSNGETAILMTLHLKGSPFSSDLETSMATLAQKIDETVSSKYPDVRIDRAGLIEHSYRAAAEVRSEISVIGTLSILGIVVLVAGVFRSLMPLIASLVTIACAVLAGICAVIVVSGSINMISLVAGTSLIGISVDYAFHYFSELRFGAAREDPATALSHIRPGVLLGFVTTLIAFVGMAAPPFPALRELALFSGVGICMAFLSVWTIFPAIPTRPGGQKAIPGEAIFARWLKGADAASSRQAVILLIVAAALCAVVVHQFLKPVDDVRAMQPNVPAATAGEKALAKFSGAPFSSQYLLVEGKDSDEVLRREEDLTPALNRLVADGKLGGYVAFSQLVPSSASQKASLEAVSSLANGDPATIDRLMDTLGLDPSVGSTFRTEIANSKPLTPDALIDSGVFSDFSELWLGRVGQETATIIALRGPVPIASLQGLVSTNNGVRFMDPVSTIDAVIHHYRSRVEWMIIAAYAAILLLLAFRYGLGGAMLTVLPPVVAALIALVVLVLSGEDYSVFATVGLILVLGIGIDYTLFFREGAENAQATALAVAMSAASTLLAFGLLAFSATPAVHTFGVTISVGISVALLIAPLARCGRKRAQGIEA